MDEEHEFTEGDVVRITKGTFASFFGTVVSVDNQNRRLAVVGRLGTEPDSGPHTLNVSFLVVEKLGGPGNRGAKRVNPVDPIRVLLADDQKLVRAGIRSLLARLPGIEVIAEASDGREAIRMVEKHEPHVVLANIALPALDGLELTRHLANTFPKIRVVIVSVYSDEEHVNLALRAGVAGYLMKGATGEELELAIRAVAQGETYLSPPVGGENDEADPLKKLSARQVQVLRLIAEGKTSKQIALELNISVKTVETFRTQLMDRLEIHDIAGLVRFAIKVGLVRLED